MASQIIDCLTQPFVQAQTKEFTKLRVTGLCEGNSPVTVEFPAHEASNAENVSLWWRRVNTSSGPRLNIKTVLSTYGDFHVKDKTAVRTSYL